MNENQTYEVVFDPEIARNASIEVIKRHKGEWIRNWMYWGAIIAVTVWFLMYTGTFHDQKEDAKGLLLLAIIIGFLSAFVYLWEHVRKSIAANIAFNQDKRWTCTMGPDKWTYEDEDGVAASIPWKLMRISDETPDVWFVKYGGPEIAVDRKPLRAAGLEEEFLSRIQGGASNLRQEVPPEPGA